MCANGASAGSQCRRMPSGRGREKTQHGIETSRRGGSTSSPRVAAGRKPSTGLKPVDGALRVREMDVAAGRKPSTGLKQIVCSSVVLHPPGRGREKTQHGIETAVPTRSRRHGGVAAGRKPSTGLKPATYPDPNTGQSGRGREKTQHGIETVRRLIVVFWVVGSRQGENPARD